MAKVKGEVDVTQEELDLLNEEFLPDTQDPETEQPFESMDLYADFVLLSAVDSYVTGTKDKKQKKVGTAYGDAERAIRDAVDDLLDV